MRTIRCLTLLTISLTAVAGCQKTIHEVRMPIQGLDSHEAMRITPNQATSPKLTLTTPAIFESTGGCGMNSGAASLM